MVLQFVFIGEGSSDSALISHLESVCLELGADEVTGIELDFQRLPKPTKKTVAAKLNAAMQLEPCADLFLIHRDADSRDSQPRHDEIAEAVAKCQCRKPWAAVVPVQETEAWLLLDEGAIRRVSNRPHGRVSLNLPSPQTVEGKANPKELLQHAIAVASETAGDRRRAVNAGFTENRRILLQNLPIYGAMRQVPAWKRMYADIKRVIDEMRGVDCVAN